MMYVKQKENSAQNFKKILPWHDTYLKMIQLLLINLKE